MRLTSCATLVLALFGLALSHQSSSQVLQKEIHLSHVHGYVLSEDGKSLPGVQVTLASGHQPSQAVTTDADGFFDFLDAKGEYLFHVRLQGFAGANRQVIVEEKRCADCERGPLYVMIKPICEDCISPIFISKKQFDEAMRLSQGKHE